MNLTLHYNFLVFLSQIVMTRLISTVCKTKQCIYQHVSRANYPEVLLHLSCNNNEDHLSLSKDNFLVC